MTSTIQNLDLSLVKMKLMDVDEGKGWTNDQCNFAEKEYKRFLNLILVYNDAVPTKAIDIFWHQHILDTRAYHTDCEQVFGKYLHHFPYFGMFGEEDHANLLTSFEKTKARYYELYKESLDRPSVFAADYSKCHDCNGKCSRCNNG
jgi:hypothetical protein